MKVKIFFCGLFFILISLTGKSQYYKLDFSSDSVAYDIQSKLNNSRLETLGADYVSVWEQLSSDYRKEIIDQLLLLGEKGHSYNSSFVGFLKMITAGINQEGLDNRKLTDLLNLSKKVIENHTHSEFIQFVNNLSAFFHHRALQAENSHQWLVLNDVYSFEYKRPFIAEVTPQEEIDEQDSWEEEEDTWNDEEYNWDEQEDEDLWEEEEDSWENWDASWDETDDEFGEEINDDMLQAYGLVTPLPEIIGPAIVFETLDLNLVTPYDSAFIKNTSGSYDLIKDVFVGKEGSFDWSPAGMKNVKATFEEYFFNTKTASFKAEKAKLIYPEKLENEVNGVFEFKSVRRDTLINNSYPRFQSYGNNIKMSGLTDDVVYNGGFTLKGQKISSKSVTGGLSRIILKNKGNIKAKAYSNLYIFNDSALYSDMATVTIYHGYDSIYHPAIRLKFNYDQDDLVIQKAKNGFRKTPFTSTYFKLHFTADILRWNLNEDKLDISILQGQKLVPVNFESVNHYNEEDYRLLGNKMYDFNPLGIVANYSEKFKTDIFYVSDLANYYKKDAEVIHGAMLMLMQKGLINYSIMSREVNLKQKGKHIYRSRFGAADYDNIIIPSVIYGKPNATVNFEEGYLKIRGVEEFLISDSLYVKIEPDSAEILIYKNRNFNFNGKVTAGNFEYLGKDFSFSYDSFLIDLNKIDSIKFYVKSENTKGNSSRDKVNNALVGLDSTTAERAGLVGFANKTSGTLYINSPGNKSSRENIPNYPKFAAGEGAVVYFDRKNVLNGVYKKELYFVIPPFDIDSLNDNDPSAIGFDGIFVSKGILPNIEERLHYVGDNAMGFDHEIPANGYKLYENEGSRLYGSLTLNSQGLRGRGKIEFLSTSFDSDDIILYPDSLIATGSMADISEEEFNNTIFPQASLDNFKVKWIPKDDEMTFSNTEEPFTFYDGIAVFKGDVMVKSDGVYGRGDIEMKGSSASSKQMKFENDRFLARHAEFAVQTDNPDKPALSGADVRVLFDLDRNYADISPEIEGRAALEFPYAQFKTSITKATWDLEENKITMTKPEDVPLKSSYFYTTREDLDSLAFNATEAIYDINTQEMTVKGIPHIKVADALITPENNEVLILENSRIGQLTNTTIILDTLHGYHHLTDGVIDISSRNEFSGYATYQFVNASNDTFAIKVEDFRLEKMSDENAGKKDKASLHTVANGSVTAQDRIIISPGIFYKGDMILYAHKPAMELDGYVKLNFTTIPGYDTWIKYSSNAEQQEVIIPFDEAITEEGKKLDAGLLFNQYDNSLYGIFVNEKLGLDDEYFFKPSGILHYKPGSESFVIEDTAKTAGNEYEGKLFSYQESSGNVKFEGPVNFVKNTEEIIVQSSVIGEGNLKDESFNLNSLLTFDFDIPSSAYDIMASDLIDVVTNLGAPEGRGDQTQLLYKLSNVMGERATREFENASFNEFTPLGTFDRSVSKPLVFSDVSLKWSPEYRGFYSDGMLGMSNVNKNELNAGFEGFIELKRNEAGGSVINIFIKASAASWYYFGLEENRLLLYSSNDDFNDYITKKSNAGKAKIDELTYLPGTEAEVLDFINRYRFEYYGINDPYIIDADADLKDKTQEDTTEEDEDDGFEDDGF